MELTWDNTGERLFETGVDHGVLYPRDNTGEYPLGVAWNGLTTVTESPSGAESNPQYADNIKYLDLQSAEELGLTIEAFTYPDAFAACDGSFVIDGVAVGQQNRQPFGLVYRTKLGNDIEGADFGYKLHLIYGCRAAPSEKAATTVNDSPEASTFSWECSTTPIAIGGSFKPTASITIDSTKVDPDKLALLEDALFGDEDSDPHLPLPAEVLDIMDISDDVTEVRLVAANAPTYNAGTHVVTLPVVAGVQWKINGVNKAPGAQPALAVGQTAEVTGHAQAGYTITTDNDWTFDY